MDQSLDEIIAFLGEAEKLKSTLRHNWMTSGRQEDSSQHSWRAALLFILMHERFGFDVDPYKTVSMLLIHDLPEVKHGDIAAFIEDTDVEKHRHHKDREAQAAKELYATLPRKIRDRYTKLQEEFEAKESPEAKVAQALEKIESQLQHLESGPKYWSDEERGDHMLNYPNAVVEALNDAQVTALWAKIRQDIYDLTYPDEDSN